MTIRNNIRPVLAALAAAAVLAGTGGAWASNLPPVHTQGGVALISGGIGKDEAAAMQAASKDWPAMLEFAAKDHARDDYLANVKVKVLDAKGHTVLHTVSKGPFLLARLEPGRYEVKASFGGKTLDRHLHIKAGQHAREVFVWPEGYTKKEG